MHFFCRGFPNEGPWIASGVYTSDYQISVRGIGEGIPEIHDEQGYFDRRDMEFAMGCIVRSAAPSAIQSSSDHDIQALLDIQAAAYNVHRAADCRSNRVVPGKYELTLPEVAEHDWSLG